MNKTYYVYIIGNHHSFLYIGITNNLVRRVEEHKSGLIKGHTQKYKLKSLLYYEILENPLTAIKREKQLKNWHREWKLNLIRKANPNFKDLYPTLFQLDRQKILKQVQEDNTMKQSHIINSDQSQQIVLAKSGDYTITLSGAGAHVDIFGAFHLKGSDKLDINVITIHAAPHTSADTLIKVIVDDQAQANVNGTIIVAKEAQQTNSFLTENILMLSDKATAHAIPNLEIEADDVKCSHAATIGKIPEEYLFYLQSRGIPLNKAKDLIAQGFLNQVYNRIAG